MLALLPALVIALTVILLFVTSYAVGRARGLYKIKAPAMTGHPIFERAWRVQMNTLEATLMFLPSLWLAAHFSSAALAGFVGLVWVAARSWYGVAYIRNPSLRGLPFMIGSLCMAILLASGLIGLIQGMWAVL
ncbi:MAPEG family protein [Oleiagrimonas sp.]|jgi:glutathione S-transferase|uniref:MAPEG family protein n=1 Tax=Oleiagrimonas sp. TaxID=2010330 RepID=UPI0026215727|nr:MAPEG family protein [Oleiagrimonas sp.]MDA3912809.1 MAPEG family protein [Oleiagrimonas sp.]